MASTSTTPSGNYDNATNCFHRIAVQVMGRENTRDATQICGGVEETKLVINLRKRKQQLEAQVSTCTRRKPPPKAKKRKLAPEGRCLICYSIICENDLTDSQKIQTSAALMDLIKFQGTLSCASAQGFSSPALGEAISKLSESPFNCLCHICNSICEEISSKQQIIRKLEQEILELQKKSLRAIRLSSKVAAKEWTSLNKSSDNTSAIECHLENVRTVRKYLLDDMLNAEKSADTTGVNEEVKSEGESDDESWIDWESKSEPTEEAEDRVDTTSCPVALDIDDDPLNENRQKSPGVTPSSDLELLSPSTDDKYKCSDEENPPSPISSNDGSLFPLESTMSSDDEYEDEVPLTEDEQEENGDDEDVVPSKDKLEEDERLSSSTNNSDSEGAPSKNEDPLRGSSEAANPEKKNRLYQKQKCDICGVILASKKNLKMHKRTVHAEARSHACEHCGLKFKVKSALEAHMRRTHKGKRYYICRLDCSKTFTIHSAFKEHLSEIHDESTDVEMHHCALCPKSFVETQAYQSHLKMHQPKKKESERKSHACHVCSETFAKHETLQTHLFRQHNETDPSKMYECGICKKKFVHKSTFQRHEKMHDPNCKMFECEHCGKMFNRKSNLNYHMKLHSSEKPFTCQMCPESFARSDQLQRHQISEHNESIPFQAHQCAECGRNFMSKSQLEEHRARYHGPGEHVCVQCGYRFVKEVALRTHISKDCGKKAFVKNNWKTQNGRLYFCNMEVGRDAENKYECPIDLCERSFEHKQGLRNHFRNSHKEIYNPSSDSPIDEKKHQCDHCGKKFISYGTLFRHIKGKHEGGFSCDICRVTRNNQATLNFHKRVEHQGIRPHVCEYCGKAYGRKERLLIHVRHHTGERPFRCDLCPKAFIRRTNLTEHQKTHHLEKDHHSQNNKKSDGRKNENVA